MFCSNCGKKNKEDAIYCGYCGYKLEETMEISIFLQEIPSEQSELVKEQTVIKKKSTFNLPSLILLGFILLEIIMWNIGGLTLQERSNVSFNEMFRIFEEYESMADVGVFGRVNLIIYFISILLALSCLYCWLVNRKSKINRFFIILYGGSMIALFIIFYLKFNSELDINLLTQVNLLGGICVVSYVLMTMFALICLIGNK